MTAGRHRPPSAATRVAGVIGDPVAHSLSPAIHNAAFAAAGLDWLYVAFAVAPGRGGDAVRAVRTLGLGGLSVTTPHKAAAAAAADRLTPAASALHAVNTVVPAGDELLGDNTDGAGLLDALAADPGWDPAGRTAVVLGTGGAARAVVLALGGGGAAAVGVVGRRPQAAAACAALAGAAGSVVDAGAAGGADLVVDATGAAMHGDSLPFDLDPGGLRAGQLVVDLVYAPPLSPLLAAAAGRGATGRNGLGMLVHQAAHQWTAWTGQPAPIDAMAEAAGLRRPPRRPTT